MEAKIKNSILGDLSLVLLLIFVQTCKINCRNGRDLDNYKVSSGSRNSISLLDPDFFPLHSSKEKEFHEDSLNFLESDDINLTKFDGCIEHLHKKPTILHHYYYYNSPYVNLSTGDGSKCIQIFDEPDCTGPSAQFINLENKHLKLNWIGRNAKEKERLLNLNLIPNSFKKCKLEIEKGSVDWLLLDYLQEKYCQAELLIRMKSQVGTKTINYGKTDNCIDVRKPLQTDTTLILPSLALSLFIIHNQYSDNQKHSDICVELFTEKGCGGDVIRYFIPADTPSSTEDLASSAYGPSRKIWEYYSSKSGVSFIDTDVKSLRKCSFCLNTSHHHHNNHHHESKERESSTTMKTTTSASIFIEPEPDDKEGVELDYNYCYFSKCQTISVYLDQVQGVQVRESGKCYFLFNDTSCSNKPFIRITELDSAELTQILSNYEQFARWALASCESIFDANRTDCLTPILENSNHSLRSIFPKGYSQESLAVGQSPLINKTVLTIGAVIGLILLILVIMIAVRLSREEL